MSARGCPSRRYPFAEIADVLRRSPAACKQLAAFARRRVGAARTPVSAPGRADVVRHVKEAYMVAIDGRVTRIWAVRNPEKLRPWAWS